MYTKRELKRAESIIRQIARDNHVTEEEVRRDMKEAMDAGRSNPDPAVQAKDHAIHSAEIFSQCKPILVGTGGLTLFPGTPLLEETQRGQFTPLTEKEMLIEMKTFVEHLTCDCYFNTHHTSGIHLSGPDFLKRKDKIIEALEHEIQHGDMDRLAAIRKNKRTL